MIFYRVADPWSIITTPLESFEYSANWPGTLQDPNYPNTFTGFDTPTNTTPLESFEYSANWPGTLENPNYPNTFTGFDTPTNTTPLESFEPGDGWSV